MAEDTFDHVKQLAQGGVWRDSNLLGDDSWVGEAATLPTSVPDQKQTIVPKTPAQEDTEILSTAIKDPEFLSALVRQIEKKMLVASGRSPGTSVLQQITAEREQAIESVRQWIETTHQTRAVETSDQSKQANTRVKSLEEKIVTLELKIEELMVSAVSQSSQEKEMIEEACRIIQERRREDEISSNITPSEVGRMDQRAQELDAQITRLASNMRKPADKPAASVPNRTKKIKFGSLF